MCDFTVGGFNRISLSSPPSMSDREKDLNLLLELYRIRVGEFQNYNTVIWALPLALIATHATAIKFLSDSPPALLAIAALNLPLLHAFWKHIHHRQCVRDALICMEYELRKHFPTGFIPTFGTNNDLLRMESSFVVLRSLVFISTIYIIIVFLRGVEWYLTL